MGPGVPTAAGSETDLRTPFSPCPHPLCASCCHCRSYCVYLSSLCVTVYCTAFPPPLPLVRLLLQLPLHLRHVRVGGQQLQAHLLARGTRLLGGCRERGSGKR